MQRTMLAAGTVLVLALVFTATQGTTYGEDKGAKKTPTKDDVKAMMAKAHKGETAPLANLGKLLKAETPDWAQVGKDIKVLTDMADLLRASKASESVYTDGPGRYLASARALDKAAHDKDRTAATTALTSLRNTCSGCHYGYPR